MAENSERTYTRAEVKKIAQVYGSMVFMLNDLSRNEYLEGVEKLADEYKERFDREIKGIPDECRSEFEGDISFLEKLFAVHCTKVDTAFSRV